MAERSKAGPSTWLAALLRVTFLTGAALLFAAMVTGAAVSLHRERRLPAVELADLVDGYLEEIEGLLQREEYDLAVDRLRVASALLYRRRELPLDMLGRAYAAQGRLEDAIEQFHRALALRPDFAEAQHNLGVAYARQGRFDPAIAAVRQALRIDPDFEIARRNLALMEEQARLGDPVAGDPAGVVGPDVAEGRALTRQFYRGQLEELHARFDPAFAARMPLAELLSMRESLNRLLGAELGVIGERVVPLGAGTRLYVRRARFEKFAGDVDIEVQLGDAHGVLGLEIRPAGVRPPGGS